MAAMLFQWLLILLLMPGLGAKKLPILLTAESKTEKVHPFYISVTEINHNSKEKTLEISCKMFADDLEQIIKKNYNVVADLTNESQKTALHKLINTYINQHLKIMVNNKPAAYQFLGFEKDKESAYCYLEVQNITQLKSLQVQNSILQDFTDQQINIIHATVNDKRQSVKLDYPKKDVSFAF